MPAVAVFDVDGVLVDTRALVRKAYAQVGVELPEDLWGTAWHTWLPERCGGDLDRARALHERKTRAHPELQHAAGGNGPRHLGKRRMLTTISAAGGVYTDDNHLLGKAVTGDGPWRLVHFDGQDAQRLTGEIEQAWTR